MKISLSVQTTAISSMRTWAKLCLAALALLVPITVLGQTTGSLTVRLVDSNGAVVANATVRVRNLETGQEREQTTDDEGTVIVGNLRPGTYAVQVTAPGFKTMTANAVVGLARAEELKLTLEIGSIGEPVTITAAADELEDALRDLPNLNNDLTTVLQVVPGALAASPAALGRIVVDGRGKEQQTLRLDGMDVTPAVDLPTGDPALGVLESLLKPNVALNGGKTDTFSGALNIRGSAQGATYALSPFYGPGTGSLIEGESYRGDKKDATKWKFQFYEAIRNDALNARNFFDYEGKNGLRRNQFGAKLGGPLKPNEAYLYVAYDGIRARAERVIYEAVPADSERGGGSGPLGQFMSSFLPPGTTIAAATLVNPDFKVARRRGRSRSESNSWDARLDVPDVTGRRNDSLSFRVTRQAAEFSIPDGVTGRSLRQRFVLASGVANLTVRQRTNEHKFKFGLSAARANIVTEVLSSMDQGLLQSLITVGVPVPVSNLPGGQSAILPTAALGGLSRSINGRGSKQTPVTFIAGYDLSSFKFAKHSIRLGVEARTIRLSFDRLGGLTYSFADQAALRSGVARTTNFLSDLSGPSPFTTGSGPRHAHQEYYLSYFQMESILTPRLILNYGLRYDYFGPVRERDNRAVVVDPKDGAFLPQGAPFYTARKNNFQPRISMTYVLPEWFGPAASMVLRAGAGIYSGVPRIGDLLLPIESDRFNTGLAGGTFPLTPAQVVQSFVDKPETRQFQPLSFARDFTTPERVDRWDAMLTRTFGGVYDLNFLYSGNIGRNLPVAGISNLIIGVETNPDPTQTANVRRQFDIERGDQLLKPFGELQFRSSVGRSSFHGMTIQFKRNNEPLPGGERWLDWRNFKAFNVQYTLGRNVGNVSGAVAAENTDFSADFGYNSSDVHHSFSFSATYQLWDKDKKRPMTHLLWGWKISPIINARTGSPLIIRLDRPDIVYVDASGNVFISPAAGRRAVINTPGGGATGGARTPDLIAGANPFLSQGLQLLDPAAFAIPQPGRFGNLRRGELRGRGSFQVDLGLTRVLFNKPKLRNDQSMSGELKIDFFNLFNRANFSNPSSTLPNALGTSLTGNLLQPGVAFNRLAAGNAFGVFNAADPGRVVQFTLTIKFNEGY
ncbi:MAG: carboxypeptidase-like regulatory domain-containing protein [Pyrinomonadaceae bacterium]